MKKIISCFFSILLFASLFGCNHKQTQATTLPAVYTLCAATSDHNMAETENGIYANYFGHLHYADKTAQNKLTPVCNKPNCTHSLSAPDCDAAITGNGFFLHQGRIYYCDSDSNYGGSNNIVIVSMSASGGDRKVEHVISFPAQEHVLQRRNCFLEDRMLLFCSCMDESGTYHNYAMQITPEGDQILAEGRTDNMPSFLGTVTTSEYVWGDPAVLYQLDLDDGSCGTMLYRITEDGLSPIGDTAGLGLGNLADGSMTGAYLTGDVLQVYRPNDGYYDINLATGEQTKTMEAQMEDSWGWRLTNQYILESPILFNRPEQRLELDPGPHTMLLYDGESWKPVILPEEVAQTSGSNSLVPNAVASDRVFFTLYNSEDRETDWYQLMLNEDEPKLTFLTSTSWK